MSAMLKSHDITRSSGIVSRHSVQLRPCSLVGSRSNSRGVSPLVCASSSSPATTTTETRTATVQVDLGYAAEQAVVTLTQPKSKLVEATMQFPLGLVLENVEGEVVVTEVSEGSAAAEANCLVGDVVRATTAYTMQMTYPTMQLMFGGGGTPKLMKVLIPAAKVPFARVMDAVRSCTRDQGGDGTVTLVLERVDHSSSSDVDSNSDDDSSDGGGAGLRVVSAEGGDSQPGAVFDPRIFNSTFE